MYTRENSNPLVECSVRRLTRSGATSMPSDVDSATRSSRRSILSLSVPPLPMGERGSGGEGSSIDRKSTRLNSSHGYISYAVFCLKKKKTTTLLITWNGGHELEAQSLLHHADEDIP